MEPTSWKTLTKIFENLSDIDNGDLNMLASSRGQKITIPVQLISELDQTTISGTVSLLPSPKNLNGAAVCLFDTAVRKNGIHLFWEKAVAGSGNVEINPGTYLAFDNMAHAMLGYDRGISLHENLIEIKKNYDYRRHNGGVPPNGLEECFDLAAAIIADSAVITSVDLERMIFDRKSAFDKFYGFKPRKIEF